MTAMTATASDVSNSYQSRGLSLPNFSTFRTREIRNGHRSRVQTVGWSTDGRRLASGSTDKTIRIWTPERSTDVRGSTELRGHTESVDNLSWDPTHPDRLATAGADKTVRFWDIRAAKPTSTVNTAGSNINVAYRPDGQEVAVGNKGDDISFIDVRKGEVLRVQKNETEVNEFAWDHTGTLFLQTEGAGNIAVMDYPTLEGLHTIVAHTTNCYCLEFDPRGRYLATGSADALVSLWDTREWICVRTLPKSEGPVRTLSFSYDGEFIASGGEDLSIDISSVETGHTVHTLRTTAATNAVAWHPSKLLLAYAGAENERSMTSAVGLRVFGLG